MTTSGSVAMVGSYDPSIVALSIVIAVSGSFAALDLAGRVTASKGWAVAMWLCCGAVSIGSGVWAMHFVGMAAFRLPVPVVYYWPTVLTSLVITILVSGAALFIVSREGMGLAYILLGGGIFGSGVAVLNYMDMSAMRMAALCEFNSLWVYISVGLSFAFAASGMWLGFYFRNEHEKTAWLRIGGGLALGSAISALHYTVMASARFLPSGVAVDMTHTMTVSTLATLGVAASTLLLLGLAMLSSLVDRRFDAKGRQLCVAEGQLELLRTMRFTLMGELTASIAHEIKQPLAAIVTNGDFCLRQLAKKAPDTEELREAILEIVNDGNRASAVVSRIRALLTKEDPHWVDLNVNELVVDVVSFVRHEIDQNNIRLQLQLAKNLPHVSGDRVQLQQVLINVVMNGIEAVRSTLDRPRHIFIKSERGLGGVRIQIMDSGPGLDPDAADRIFEPFFTTKPEGVGLGLSISRSILESHGGRMWGTSCPYGAIFEINLSTGTEETE
jgi:two-component system, sensor histidine kinase and response regulator